jgi:serine protease
VRTALWLLALMLACWPGSVWAASGMVTPTDTLFEKQWALKMVRAPEAWKRTVGSRGVTMAIIDTGVVKHPDLYARIIGGYDFIGDAENAGDGDGRDDDPQDEGDATDESSGLHGTHIAGIAAAISDNDTGVAGVDWQCRLVIARVLGVQQATGTDVDIADAIRWSAGLHVDGVPDNEHPAQVINMSFGSAGHSDRMQDAIHDALNAGAIVVASAGNAGEEASGQSPGGLSGVITVGAVGPGGKRAIYSNFGDAVTIMAPGGGASTGGILSTSGLIDTQFTYVDHVGTSEAAAFVSGAVSLMKGVYQDMTAEDARRILEDTADDSALCEKGCGAGLLNVEAAIDKAQRAGRPVGADHDGYRCSAAAATGSAGSIPTSAGLTGLVYIMHLMRNSRRRIHRKKSKI